MDFIYYFIFLLILSYEWLSHLSLFHSTKLLTIIRRRYFFRRTAMITRYTCNRYSSLASCKSALSCMYWRKKPLQINVQSLEASLPLPLQALEASLHLLEARLSISTDDIDVYFELSENLASNLCNVREIKEDESLSLVDKVRQCKSHTALHILQDGWSDGKKRMARRIFFDPKTSLLTEEEHTERFREYRRNRKKKGGNNNNTKGKAVKSKKANTSTNQLQQQQPVVITTTSSELVVSSRVVESLPPPPQQQHQQTPSAASVVEDVLIDTAVVVASPVDGVDDTTVTVVESANVVLPPDVDVTNETAVFFVKSVSDGVVCEYAHCGGMSVGELKEKVAVNMSVQVESIQLSIESIGMVSTSSIDKDDATLEQYSIYPLTTLRLQCADDVIDGLLGGARTSSRQSSGGRGGRGSGRGRGRVVSCRISDHLANKPHTASLNDGSGLSIVLGLESRAVAQISTLGDIFFPNSSFEQRGELKYVPISPLCTDAGTYHIPDTDKIGRVVNLGRATAGRYKDNKFQIAFNYDYAQKDSIDILRKLQLDIHEICKFSSHEELLNMTLTGAAQWSNKTKLSFFYHINTRSLVFSEDKCAIFGGGSTIRGKVKARDLNAVESGQQNYFPTLGIPVQPSSIIHEDKIDDLMSFCNNADAVVQGHVVGSISKVEEYVQSPLANVTFVRSISSVSWRPEYPPLKSGETRIVVTPSLYNELLDEEDAFGEGGTAMDVYTRSPPADDPHDDSIYTAEEHEFVRTEHVMVIREHKISATDGVNKVSLCVRYIFMEDCKIAYKDVSYTLKDVIEKEGYIKVDEFLNCIIYGHKNVDGQVSLIIHHTPWCPILLSKIDGYFSLDELDRHTITAMSFHYAQAVVKTFTNPSDPIQTNQSIFGNALTAIAMRVHSSRRAHEDNCVAARMGLSLLVGHREGKSPLALKNHGLQVVDVRKYERDRRKYDKIRLTESKLDYHVGRSSKNILSMARTDDQRTYYLEQTLKIIMYSRLTNKKRSPSAQHALLTTMERSGNFSEECIATLRSLVDSLKGNSEHDSALSIAEDLLAELAKVETEEEKKAILIRVVNDWLKTSRVTGNHRPPFRQHSLITTMERSGKVDGQLITSLRSLVDTLKGNSEHDSALSIAEDLLAVVAEATTEEEKKAILIRVVNDWLKTSRVTGNHRPPFRQHSLITTMERSGKVDGQLITSLRSLIDPLQGSRGEYDSALSIAEDLLAELAEATTEEEKKVILIRVVNDCLKTSRITGIRRSPSWQHKLITTMERSGKIDVQLTTTLRSSIEPLTERSEHDSALSIAEDLLAELAEATTEEEKKVILIRVANDWIKTSRVTGNRRKPTAQHALITTMERSGKVNEQLTTSMRSLIDPLRLSTHITNFHYTLADNSSNIQLPAVGERVTIYQLQQTPDGKQVMVPIVMKLKYQATVPTATVQAQPSYQFYQEISTSIGKQLQPISMIQSDKPGIFFWPQDSNGTSTCGMVARVGVLKDHYYPLTPVFYTPKDKSEELKWENDFEACFGKSVAKFKKAEENLANRCAKYSVTYIPPLL